MFKSIEFIDATYNVINNLYLYEYKIIDSDFVSITLISIAPAPAPHIVSREEVRTAGAVIKEYESRNYTHQEIIGNLFLLNMFILKKYHYYNINDILSFQSHYLTKDYYHEINYRKYYDDLVKYTKKMTILC